MTKAIEMARAVSYLEAFAALLQKNGFEDTLIDGAAAVEIYAALQIVLPSANKE